ncbi:MAG: SAP domain-containing protein [Chloroflexi bacterium]|nr:SAP domain-containing protein [Chloroflexota bacterium]
MMEKDVSNRPALNDQISLLDFRAFYWLKSELIAFCQRHGLPTTGSKTSLAERIVVFLSTGEMRRPRIERRAWAKMPDRFSHDTVVGPNWRCSQELRAFFVAEIGPQFHFNGVMRDFIKKDGVGKTLQDAIDAWHQEKRRPRAKTEIAPQFEYNRHVREFFKQNPGKTLHDAISAWNEKKAKRKGDKQE